MDEIETITIETTFFSKSSEQFDCNVLGTNPLISKFKAYMSLSSVIDENKMSDGGGQKGVTYFLNGILLQITKH